MVAVYVWRMLNKILLLLFILLSTSATTLAGADDAKDNGTALIPEQVPCEHWTYKEVKELGENTPRKRNFLKGRPARKANCANAFFLYLIKLSKNARKRVVKRFPVRTWTELQLCTRR